MLSERSKQVRRDVIKLMYEHNMSHYGGSLSCIEILIALYDHVLNENDVFLLSKGHACAPLYVLLREKGLDPAIEHHPQYDPANGIYMTSGSLGHGLPFGIGVALAKKLKGEPGRVFVLVGDGEMAEGTALESRLIMNRLGLSNIKIIVDSNKIQGSDRVENVLSYPLIDPAFLFDGHDAEQLSYSLKSSHYLIQYFNTIKGFGISFMSNDVLWHSRQLTEQEYKQAMEELA